MKIRRRDGTMAEVGDDYMLQDGEAMMFEMRFMDSRRPMIHDGNGHPAGQRPGFLYSDANEQAEQAVADAYAAYDEAISERWRGQPAKQTQSAPQRTFDNPQAALADAYRQYDKDISERWRRGQPAKQTESAPQVFDSPEAAVAAAYAEYEKAICERWRK